MRNARLSLATAILAVTAAAPAADLTIPNGGRVSIELINSFAAFNNTLSVNSPTGISIAFSGCQLQPADGLGGLHVVSEENSQRGCRVDLDADASTPGVIDDFAAGTTFEFGMCAQTDADDACEFVWSSNPSNNSDGEDHVITDNFATDAWRLSWEDLANLGDMDFNDLIVVFRVQQDTDGDGLWDDWEVLGVDTTGDGVPEITLPGADPQRKDIYVEIDCLVSDGNGNGSTSDLQDHSHCPTQNAMTDVVMAFASAPVTNADGTIGIQLHLDVGTLYGAGITAVMGPNGVTGTLGNLGGGNQIDEAGNEIIDWDGATGRAGTSLYDLKTANFDNDRRFAYRYAIFGHQTNARRAVNDCTSGWAEGFTGNDMMITLGGLRDLDGDGTGDIGCWTSTAANGIDDDGDGAVDEDPRDGIDNDGDCVAGTDTDGDGNDCDFGDIGVDEDGGFSLGSRGDNAGTFMHELGHLLNLEHGGGDSDNRKPNYPSVMNYRLGWQSCNVPTSAAAAGIFPGGCTFSTTVLPPTVAGTLNEASLDECAGIDANAGWFGPMDWDGDGTLSGVTNCQPPNSTNVQADINSAGGNSQMLAGFDDWANLIYAFQNDVTFVNGIADPVEDEQDAQTYDDIVRSVTLQYAPSVAFEVNAPATALPGDTVTAVGNILNSGRGPGTEAEADLESPFGDIESFELDVLKLGTAREIDIDFDIAPDACPEILTVEGEVRYRDFAGNHLSNTASAAVEVLDVTPPELTVELTPDSIWPPNHKMREITAAITVVDECDPNPQVRLVSIESSEADNGLGDGDTANDIQDAALGTDDRVFSLRSERSGQAGFRVYSIVYEASDASGNTTSQSVTVEVSL